MDEEIGLGRFGLGRFEWRTAGRIMALCGTALVAASAAHAGVAAALPPAIDAPCAQPVLSELSPLAGVTDLKFRDLFKLPVGSRGLEPTGALLALDGRRVRMVGYMARQAPGLEVPDVMILVPLPVELGDEDETFADDLPASAAYVQRPGAHAAPWAFRPGLMAVTGRLQIGARAEPDGRVSFVRLQADDCAAGRVGVGPAPASNLVIDPRGVAQ